MNNRQLVIYDKRAEVIAKGKLGWLTIWNAARAEAGKPPLDLKDRHQSQVWRFELRMGSKQLRNRYEMRSWADLDAMIGDAYSAFCERVRYTVPNTDRNRAKWPTHELWDAVAEVVAGDLGRMRSGVVPEDVKEANRREHMRMLDAQILGLMYHVWRLGGGIVGDDFESFLTRHVLALKEASNNNAAPIDERLAKVEARYPFR